MSQEDKPQTHTTVREISGGRVFIGSLCPRLFVRTYIWNVSTGAVHRSWQTRAALLAWSALTFCFRSSHSMPLTLFSLRTKRYFRSLHLTIGRTKSVADCGNFWRRSLISFFFSAGTARSANAWPPVNYACVPQLFEQLINTAICPAFLRKFVCQPLRCTPLQIQTFLSKPCPCRLISCWLLTNRVVTCLRWRISDATNWAPK